MIDLTKTSLASHFAARDVPVPTAVYALGLCKAFVLVSRFPKNSRTFASVLGFTRSPLAISMIVLLSVFVARAAFEFQI